MFEMPVRPYLLYVTTSTTHTLGTIWFMRIFRLLIYDPFAYQTEEVSVHELPGWEMIISILVLWVNLCLSLRKHFHGASAALSNPFQFHFVVTDEWMAFWYWVPINREFCWVTEFNGAYLLEGTDDKLVANLRGLKIMIIYCRTRKYSNNNNKRFQRHVEHQIWQFWIQRARYFWNLEP